MPDSPQSDHVSTQQQRIAQLAQQRPERMFLSLNQYLQLPWLEAAFARVRKDAATGVDGQTAEQYAANLQDNLRSLLDRAKSGVYRAPPVRRVWIAKRAGSTETRPLGIPTFEDKVLQRAVVMILEPIYEQDFLNCSYGYRPGRSPHQALHALREQLMQEQGGWLLEVDIRQFFDTLDHSVLRQLLRKRIGDGVILRLIGKWLNAGVWEQGTLTHPDAGTFQGNVISPLLANIYLHYVLDVWFHQEVLPRLAGKASLIRYADDFVLVFTREDDARRVQQVLPQRFANHGLALHPEKTRLIRFVRPRDRSPNEPQPDTFDLLGFTHFWGRSRNGYWVVKRKTAKSRLHRAIQAVAHWCRKHLHDPVADQYQTLCRKLRGHDAYYGITGNSWALSSFHEFVQRAWRKWLSRRKRGHPMTWEQFNRLRQRYPLPRPAILHNI